MFTHTVARRLCDCCHTCICLIIYFSEWFKQEYGANEIGSDESESDDDFDYDDDTDIGVVLNDMFVGCATEPGE